MRRLGLLLVLPLVFGVGPTPLDGDAPAGLTPSASAAEVSAPAPRRAPRVRIKGHFNLATFNVLGNDHTEGRGRRPGFASGVRRMRYTVRAFHARKVDVVALQEFQDEQWRAFRKLTGGRYRVWAHKRDRANAVAWRARKFAFVRGRTIGVPYFDGEIKQMPVVVLRHRATRQKMVFTSFHNPVTSKRRPGNDKWRRQAIAREITLANRLRRHGVPTFLSGDFNERSERWHCRVARATKMVTAGSRSRRGGSCRPPDRLQVDWIFGSAGVIFRNYVAVESRRVRRASDHPLIVVRVS